MSFDHQDAGDEGFSSMPRLGDVAPDFHATTTMGELHFHDWKRGAWAIFFSHPADFTPVCATELAALAARHEEFAERNTKLLGLSVDSIHSHLAWVENLRQVHGATLPFPIVADGSTEIASRFGMIHPGESTTLTVRALFIVDPKHVVRTLLYYPMDVGRSVDEMLRTLDALQLTDKQQVACPADWTPGDDVVLPPPRTVEELRAVADDVEQVDFYVRKRSPQ